ncbi:hypothetical protein HUU62_19475 [Rhodoferax sp. 4810]|nr:hypothetical protein [Rhodoferax jenense]
MMLFLLGFTLKRSFLSNLGKIQPLRNRSICHGAKEAPKGRHCQETE